MTLIPFAPNHRTATRKRREREATKQRLIKKIGIDKHDAPLYEEELALWAYEESLRK